MTPYYEYGVSQKKAKQRWQLCFGEKGGATTGKVLMGFPVWVLQRQGEGLLGSNGPGNGFDLVFRDGLVRLDDSQGIPALVVSRSRDVVDIDAGLGKQLPDGGDDAGAVLVAQDEGVAC